jgi:hypothetical protein
MHVTFVMSNARGFTETILEQRISPVRVRIRISFLNLTVTITVQFFKHDSS